MIETSKNSSSSQQRKDIKHMAKSVLNDHNVRLKLIMASLICVASFMLTEVIKGSIYYALSFLILPEQAEAFEIVFDALFSLVRLLILSPLFIGFFSISVKLASGKNTDFHELFGFYTGLKTIFRTWAIGAVVMLPQTVLFFLFLNIPKICKSLVQKSLKPDIDAYFILGAVALEIGVVVLSVLSLRLYTVINAYVCGSSQSVGKCIRAALRSMKGNVFGALTFIVSFIPWVLLSLCTVGVLFVIFTIPYMIVSYNIYSSHLITKSLTSHRNSEEI